MRLGCGGCLGSLLLLSILGAGVLAVVWVGSRVAGTPEQGPARGTERDGLQAQQTLFEIMRRSTSRRPSGQRTRSEYILREAEFNAFLAHHLGRVAGLPLTDPAVSFVGGGVIELRGQLDLAEVAAETSLLGYLPESWQKAGVTLTLRGPLRLETETSRGQAKALRFEIDEAHIGRQRVPVFALERFLATNDRLGRWSVPDSVTSVIIEKGRAVVQIES